MAMILGEDTFFRASKVALTMLWGLDVPTDLATMSCIPRASKTALIGPPAITPVPDGALLR